MTDRHQVGPGCHMVLYMGPGSPYGPIYRYLEALGSYIQVPRGLLVGRASWYLPVVHPLYRPAYRTHTASRV